MSRSKSIETRKRSRPKPERLVSATSAHERLVLCGKAREIFVNALMSPPEPNKALRAAAKRYKKHVGIA